MPDTSEVSHARPLTAYLMGPLIVRRGDVELDARALGGPKPRQILEILLLNVGYPVSKDRLIDLLWGNTPPREAVTSVESYVSVLRRRLQPGSGKAGPLRTTTGGYLIDAASVDLDLVRFEALVREAAGAKALTAHTLLGEALALSRGPLLSDELAPLAWVEDARRRHTAALTEARVDAANSARSLARPDEAALLAERALIDDPLHEAAWLALILALEEAAKPAAGLQAFADCRSVLRRELGCEPSAVLQKAYARLLTATASGADELSSAVSALLVLSARLEDRAAGVSSTRAMRDQVRTRESVRQARQVLTRFLNRVLEIA